MVEDLRGQGCEGSYDAARRYAGRGDHDGEGPHVRLCHSLMLFVRAYPRETKVLRARPRFLPALNKLSNCIRRFDADRGPLSDLSKKIACELELVERPGEVISLEVVACDAA